MATLFISVWDNASQTLLGQPLQETSVAIGAASAQSDAITGSNKETRLVRVFADADCYVTWGSDPTASSADGRPMGAENPEVFGIVAGEKIAVIERV